MTWFDVAAGEVVGFELVGGHLDAGLHRGDAAIDDQPDRHFAQLHGDQGAEADRRPGHARLDPDVDERDDDDEDDQGDNPQDDASNTERIIQHGCVVLLVD